MFEDGLILGGGGWKMGEYILSELACGSCVLLSYVLEQAPTITLKQETACLGGENDRGALPRGGGDVRHHDFRYVCVKQSVP
jgi:hypothetical protein